MATVLKTNGVRMDLVGENDGKLSLAQIQFGVGGYFSPIWIIDQYMLVNDEGRMKGLPINQKASEIYGKIIIGDVILCSEEEMG